MSNPLSPLPIVVLCGGQGTRLREAVPNRPKILAPIGTQTLLDGLMAMLTDTGFRTIILSVGHLKEQVKEYCAKKRYRVSFSEEDRPLGTGGALKRALDLVHAPRFYALNGDMIFRPDWNALHRFHLKMGGIASLFIARAYDGEGGSVVRTEGNGRIVSWRAKTERDSAARLFLNAGVYLMEKRIADFFPTASCFSLETEVFPVLMEHGLYGLETQAPCIDIGTPERYALAQKSALW